jgi:hypothetical protein
MNNHYTELRPNEKMVDSCGTPDVYATGGIDKSFESHPIIWADLDQFCLYPLFVNLSDFRQTDIYKGLLAF